MSGPARTAVPRDESVGKSAVAAGRRGASLRGRVAALTGSAAVRVGAIVLLAFAGSVVYVSELRNFLTLDDLAYTRQAMTIGERLGLVTPGADFYANSWSQLGPVVMAPFFRWLSVPGAFEAVHVVNAFLMASVAVPVFLLTRDISRSDAASYFSAALSVAVPWMALSGTMLTEVVAYPVFAWAVLAMYRAIVLPAPWRDIVAIVALAVAYFARVQFLVLAPAFAVAIFGHELLWAVRQPGGRWWRRLGGGLLAAIRSHAVVWIAVVAMASAALGAGLVSRLVGPWYGNALSGTFLPSDSFAVAGKYLGSISLAIGLVPVVLYLAWTVLSLLAPRDRERHAFAVLALLVVVCLTLVVTSAAARFIEGVEERYLFFIAPLVFVGAALFLEERRRSAVVLAGAAAVTFVSLLSVAYVAENPFIASASGYFHPVVVGQSIALGRHLGVDHLDAWVVGAALLALSVILVSVGARLLSARAMLAIVGVALAGFLVAETAFVMHRVITVQRGFYADDVSSRDWVDRSLPAGEKAAIMLSPVGPNDQLNATLWNDIGQWNRRIVAVNSASGGLGVAWIGISPAGHVTFDDRGRAISGSWPGYLVIDEKDRRFGLPGAEVVAERNGIQLVKYDRTARLEYGLLSVDPDATFPVIDGGGELAARVYMSPRRLRAGVELANPGPGAARYEIRSGGRAVSGAIAPAQAAMPEIELSRGRGRIATIEVRNAGRGSANGPLQFVRISLGPERRLKPPG